MKHRHLIKIFGISLIISACAACNKVTPIAYNCPAIILPPDPIPATKFLNSKSQPNDVIKAWVATAYSYRGWNKTVRKQIESSK